MSIICFIPARGGSKSIPNKNIKELGGKPLIAWSIETAFKCGFDRVIVNTDSEKIAEVAKKYQAEVMIRPPELGQDKTSMFEMLKSEIPKIEGAEIIVLLQPTSPFRKSLYVKTAIGLFLNNNYSSIITVERVPEKYNPAQVLINKFGKYCMADGTQIKNRITDRQSFPEAYIPDGSCYIFRVENLEKGSIYGDNIMLIENPGTPNINTMEDFLEAEKLINQNVNL